MSNINTLDFKMFDPVEAGEEWAVDFGSNHKVVEIYIDGQRLLDTIREIEIPYAQGEDSPELAGDYGHVSPRELYSDLSTAADENSYSHDLGVYLFCCASCGEPGCWSVTLRVREDADFVYWYGFEHEHRGWEYNLEYKFEKKAYEQAMKKLENMSHWQRL